MGKTETSKLSINIKSRLNGSESEPEDIEPPFAIKGPILLRLILLLLFVFFNFYILYALYLYFKINEGCRCLLEFNSHSIR